MKKALLTSIVFAAISSQAALPSLTDIAETISNLKERLAESTNWQASAEAHIEAFRERMEDIAASRDALLVLVEGDKNLRERFHGGRLGQYILTNELDRIIRVDLYGDGSAWTNGTSQAVSLPRDPEERKKEERRRAEERERVQAAWEAANLPPDLAALRARQREIDRQINEEEE